MSVKQFIIQRLAGLLSNPRWLIAAVVLVLCAGLAVGFLFGQTSAPQKATIPTAAMVAAAPHPVVKATDDAPATEVSRQTVVEEDSSEPPPQPPKNEPPQSVALAVPPPSAVAPGMPAWRRFAVPSPAPHGRPMIAMIIDDMGVDKRRSERILQLPGPLTVSFMAYAEDLDRQTAEARQHGHELMMHVPMEPLAADVDPGPNALLTTLSQAELKRRVELDLNRFPGYVGINNHMGSKFTASTPGMRVVMAELARRGLFFVDSLTTEHSVGLTEARQAGIPAVGRNVFIDNVGEVGAVEAQLAKCEELARRRGFAIAIGHPREATIAALSAWLPSLEHKGLVLVPVSAIVAARLSAPLTPAGH